jgi:hypothetical protein
MKLRFPLDDVIIETATVKRSVQLPLYEDGFYSLNQYEFSMDVDGVASFYVSGGNYISVFPYPESNIGTIELYLNGSAFGAILHQRKILPLHGSCLNHNGLGIMICGVSGAGKSSLIASFCLHGAEFLTDDVTPVLFKSGLPVIWSISDRIKLWNDTLQQLNQDDKNLLRIDPGTDKYYYPISQDKRTDLRLNLIYILQLHDNPEVEFTEISGASKSIALRKEIYRYEYLYGMPDNEKVYFKSFTDINNNVRIFSVRRPDNILIVDLMTKTKDHICKHYNL